MVIPDQCIGLIVLIVLVLIGLGYIILPFYVHDVVSSPTHYECIFTRLYVQDFSDIGIFEV